MINSGQQDATHNTGGWTDYSQEDDACSGTNAHDLKDIISSCPASGNQGTLTFGQDISLTNGMTESVFKPLYECWVAQTNKQQVWELTLPVVSCPTNVVGPTCSELLGVIDVTIIWINDINDPLYNNAPTIMYSNDDPPQLLWSSSNPDGEARWNDFVSTFNLVNLDGLPAPYAFMSIYFLPHCGPHETTGFTGGQNFGISGQNSSVGGLAERQ